MKQIDFLPQRFRDDHTRRQVGTWRLLVCILFGGAIVAASCGQFWYRANVRAQIDQIQPLLAESEMKKTHLAQLQADLTQVTHQANVCALLQCRWPRRQIVAVVIGPIPDSIQVEELHVEQRARALADPRPMANVEGAKEKSEELSPAARDATALEQQLRNDETVATISGVTQDIAALHSYLEHLERLPLVARTELLSVDNQVVGPAKGRQKFVAEVLMISPLPTEQKPTSNSLAENSP